jgi:glutathione synthase/RimK-type ligase-like ATP-grasp enzyme
MDAAGVPSRVLPFPHPPFTVFDGRAYPKVIFNRVAIRATKGSPGIITLARDLLSALQLQDKHIINNRHCHQVGSSKALQALVFERAGVKSPKTFVLHDKAMLTPAREQMPDGLLKSNVGGFGAGVWAPESPDQDAPPSILSAAFAADGLAVWQQRYIPRDDVIYRVEMLDGEVLYRARVSVKPDSFNYCF